MIKYLNYPLRLLSYLRAGAGKIEEIYFPETYKEIEELVKIFPPQKIVVWGKGSNFLLSDQLPSSFLYISTQALKEKFLLEDNFVKISAGFSLSALLSSLFSVKKGANLRFLVGIPGSVGGAIYMNAGGGINQEEEWIGTWVEEVLALDLESKKIVSFSKTELDFSYRSSFFKKAGRKRYIILEVKIRLKGKITLEIKKDILRRIRKKQETQPLRLPSLGSVFRNFPDKNSWELIKSVFPKGAKRGSVAISDKHYNFIVVKEREKFKFQDYKMLIEKISTCVKEKTGIKLEREIEFFEDFYKRGDSEKE